MVFETRMLQKKLGQRMAELRRSQQLTQVQFAKAVGCSVEFISLVERGVNAPSVARLEDFANALKVTVVDLFTFAGRKPTRIGRKRIP
jgi:transcriptional regulator with XRE-family HTH domain